MFRFIKSFSLLVLISFSSLVHAECTVDVKYINGINNNWREIQDAQNALRNLLSSRSEICSVEAIPNISYGIIDDLLELEAGKALNADDWSSKILAAIKFQLLTLTKPKEYINALVSGTSLTDIIFDRVRNNFSNIKASIQASYDAGRKKVIVITHSQGSMFGKAARIHFQKAGKSIQTFYIAPAIDLGDEPGCDTSKKVTDICHIYSTADTVISLSTDRSWLNFAATSNQFNLLSGLALIGYYLSPDSKGEWTDNTIYSDGRKITSSNTRAMIERGVGYMINHPPQIFVK
jgi:hypothetical protein